MGCEKREMKQLRLVVHKARKIIVFGSEGPGRQRTRIDSPMALVVLLPYKDGLKMVNTRSLNLSIRQKGRK